MCPRHLEEEQRVLSALIAETAVPLPADIDEPTFGALFDRFADRRIVLLGEASHGTSEFYRARAAITRHLIQAHGFNFVAVEADWPDAHVFNRYVRHWPPATGQRQRSNKAAVFSRFPTWMWKNAEVDALMHWMRNYNEGRETQQQAGFYGMDLYNMSASIAEVIGYLEKVDPEAAKLARVRYGCLEPWLDDPADYGLASLCRGYALCEKGVVKQCRELLEHELEYSSRPGNHEQFLNAAQNARLIEAAEQYYRVMYYGGADSWNLRDTHMFETLCHLLEAHGPHSKAIVWAHNSHIGDARYTDMGQRRRELNIGQLCREHFGEEQCALVGFGTHTGEVAAADDWGGKMQIKKVRPSLAGSVEQLCHNSLVPRFLLDLRTGHSESELRRLLMARTRFERFIGVIYRPDTERQSHYSEALLPQQFDAYVWFDQTTPITPLGPQHMRPGMPDTYPFGL